jgi:transposase
VIPVIHGATASEAAMMGRQIGDQASLFYEFRLDDRIPKEHLLRRINLFLTPVLGGMHLGGMHEQLATYYSEIGRPSIDPELMVRMLIVGYCYGLRSERKLTQEVELHLAYRWFCRLDLDDTVPHHSTFSENRLHRFRQSDVFRTLTLEESLNELEAILIRVLEPRLNRRGPNWVNTEEYLQYFSENQEVDGEDDTNADE